MSKRKGKFLLRMTEKEFILFQDLKQKLKDDLDISKQRTSEIVFEGFKQYAEQLLTSYIPTTQTKTQSNTSQRKTAIFNLIESIEEKGFMFIMESYVQLLKMNTCFEDVKIRTKSSYFQQLITSEDLAFIYLPNYTITQTQNPLVIIPRKSKWYNQLRDLCFTIKEPIWNITHDNITEDKFRSGIIERLAKKSKNKIKLDRAEKTMFNIFLYDIGELRDKPMYDQTDFNLMEIIRLRSEGKFFEAQNIIDYETQKEKTKAVEFLSQYGKGQYKTRYGLEEEE